MTTVYRSRLIAAPADKVWALVRDFAGVDRWVPTLPAPPELVGDPDEQFAEQLTTGMGVGTFEPGLQHLAELCEKD